LWPWGTIVGFMHRRWHRFLRSRRRWNIARSASWYVDRFLYWNVCRNRSLRRCRRIFDACVDRVRRNQSVRPTLAAPTAGAKYLLVDRISRSRPKGRTKRIFNEAEHCPPLLSVRWLPTAAGLAFIRYATLYRQMVCQRSSAKNRGRGTRQYCGLEETIFRLQKFGVNFLG
jgi:hypothetical protein